MEKLPRKFFPLIDNFFLEIEATDLFITQQEFINWDTLLGEMIFLGEI